MTNYQVQQASPQNTSLIMNDELMIGRLKLKNRLLRSSISGRIDNYDGSGTPARVNFEERFARGGVAAIISSHVPISPHARVLPNYAMIDRDERIDFWKSVGKRVHRHDCHFILQLSHSGRQQDIGGVENWGSVPWGATNRPDYFNGLPSQSMTVAQIREVVQMFARAAERVAKAGLDGIELHSANGYLFTQFLSSAINDRTDEFGGPLENRYRFLREVIEAIQKAVGRDFPLIVKVTGHDYHSAASFLPRGQGNGIEEAIQISKWVEEAGVHAIHVSTGNMFPHPMNPAGPLPTEVAKRTYQAVISSGRRTFLNFLAFRYALTRPLAKSLWRKSQPFNKPDGTVDPERLEGFAAADARAIKQAVKIPVLLTGGFQTAHGIAKALLDSCDAVTIARPLLANPNLPLDLKDGWDGPVNEPCTYCNKCLLHVIENPLGCYEESRFANRGGREAMLQEVFEIFKDYQDCKDNQEDSRE